MRRQSRNRGYRGHRGGNRRWGDDRAMVDPAAHSPSQAPCSAQYYGPVKIYHIHKY